MAKPDSPIIENQLGIHVLSESLGESIIVTLPDGKWFVVDAFIGSSGNNNDEELHAVWEFIQRFELQPADCLFVLLTHLHEDHYKGVPSLLRRLRRYKPDLPFVRHSAYEQDSCLEHMSKLLKWRDKQASSLQQAGARATEVIQLFAKGCYPVSQWTLLHNNPEMDCYVSTVMPSNEIVRDWIKGGFLVAGLNVKPDEKEAVRKTIREQDKILNNMSLALCITFGEASVLLAGDCEKGAWKCLTAQGKPQIHVAGPADPLATVRFMKAPHHGSVRAWHDNLEQLYRQCDSTIATHHCRGNRYNLPDAAGVDKILAQEVTVAVPDRQLLEENLKVRRSDSGSFHRIPVTFGASGSQEQARSYSKKWQRDVSVDPDTEIAWVSRSFSRRGVSGHGWFGGSRATLFTPN